MKAALFYGKKDLRVEDIDMPKAGPGEVVIRTKRVGICGTDLHDYVVGPKSCPTEPHPLTGSKIPIIFGHEVSGDVYEVGEGVEGVKVGDRVTAMALQGCGECYYCKRGLRNICIMQAGMGLQWYWGGYAEYCKVKDYQIVKLPDNLTYQQGALVELTSIALHSIERGRFQLMKSALVTGGGPIGAIQLMACVQAGADVAYITETSKGRLAMLKDIGADEVFNPKEVDVVEEIMKRTNDVGVDFAFECSGAESAINECFYALRKQGTYVQSGLNVGQIVVTPWDWSMKELNMYGVWCFKTYDWDRVARLVPRIPVDKIVTSVINLSDVVDAFEELAFNPDTKESKVHIEFDW